ncbi:MAG: hypothetical protein Q4F45_09130 [Alistipes sp.]|nr:hypothetical protein [Alistipes sp.]
MKHLISIVLFVFGAMQGISQQAEETVYTFSNGDIMVNGKFRPTSNIGDWEDITPYDNVGLINFTNENQEFKIALQNYKNWDEGGTFRVINILHNGIRLLQFIEENSWNTPLKSHTNSYSIRNDFCIIYPLANNATAIIFEGFSWSSQVPLLTIIVVKGNRAKVVFSQAWGIERFNAYSKGFELTLIDDFEFPQNTYKLYTTSDGTMKFKKIK